MATKTELKVIVSLRAIAYFKATARLRAIAQPKKLPVTNQVAAKTELYIVISFKAISLA